ncbi:MAG TPA: hypothetical protein VI358_18035 [Pseudolabrys sp.]
MSGVSNFSWLPFYKQQKLQGNIIQPGTILLPITASSAEFPQGPTRAIVCTTAGTVDWVDVDGNSVTAFPVWAQMVLPLGVVKVTSITTAVIYGIW